MTKTILDAADQNRKQLFDCIVQLAERASETGELHISSCLNTLCGAIVANDDNQLSFFCEAFSRLKVDQLEKEQVLMDKLFGDLKKEQSE